MEIATDASSWINLSNAAALDTVMQLPGHEFLFSPLVAGECHAECAGKIIQLSETCAITRLTDDQINGDQFLELLEMYGLGDGETECLAICAVRNNSLICCDDRRARQAAEQMFGRGRVIGSLTLLKRAVEAGLASPQEAYGFYQAMKNAGGFLPDQPPEWFDPARG